MSVHFHHDLDPSSAEPFLVATSKARDDDIGFEEADLGASRPLYRGIVVQDVCIRIIYSPWLPWFLLVLAGAALLHQTICPWTAEQAETHPGPPHLLYSPAQDAVEYEVHKFHLGLDTDLTEYQGEPSPELDRRWSELYNVGINLIPLESARQLPNRTILFPHDEQRRYLVELDVFHQLHCLNMIRKALRPDYYKPHLPGPQPGDEDELLGPQHIDHCVDALRQSLMCNADISVLVWGWHQGRQRHTERGTILHTCKRFDKIHEWARQHAVYEAMDNGFREMNDPLDPSTWEGGYHGED
ncbi:hypothetical protein CMQ_997 [Grosmannia clavigera kw1407]|uniref:Tat pathway signal sequence n=1 Tax=Grosmannia clavigera (strain kw1407 / UAMH 11150) TaxID=655863 RepID=F0XEV7_GROCL|nr:uncharacterized protein CMQ_997 [Grosmannia clavigera kw1407]EFX04069.1 hypothetical protein CMQ_997 [Grosmannia clavigera kw1407]